jgi:hypothetical protein
LENQFWFRDFLIFTLLQTFSAVSKAKVFKKIDFSLLLIKIVTKSFIKLALEATAQHKLSSIYLDTVLKKLFF